MSCPLVGCLIKEECEWNVPHLGKGMEVGRSLEKKGKEMYLYLCLFIYQSPAMC